VGSVCLLLVTGAAGNLTRIPRRVESANPGPADERTISVGAVALSDLKRTAPQIFRSGRWPPGPLRQHAPVLSRTGRPFERLVRPRPGRSPAPR